MDEPWCATTGSSGARKSTTKPVTNPSRRQAIKRTRARDAGTITPRRKRCINRFRRRACLPNRASRAGTRIENRTSFSDRSVPQNVERPLILHLSADYPSPHRGPTTTAVKRLVEGIPEADHLVVSLFRTSDPRKVRFIDCGTQNGVRLIAYRYFAPPMGMLLAHCMRAVARRVLRFLETEKLRPSTVHAHKFAFEGIAALWLVDNCGYELRMLVSVRGEADQKVLLYKRTYRRLLQRIADRADLIYHVSAWFRPTMNRYLDISPSKQTLLPNIVANTTTPPASHPAEPRFVCVLNLDIRKRKGLRDVLVAYAEFQKTHPNIGLDIIGHGRPESVDDVTRQVRDLDLEQNVRLIGRLSGEELFVRLPSYLALVLPSFNETFGMVYVEALFAGIPILYGRGTGIDGYLEDLLVGVAVTPGKTSEILQALGELSGNNTAYREAISNARGILFERFAQVNILNRYRADLLDSHAHSTQAAQTP
nr:glycosyltransferase [Labrenzia sp. VG12]